MIVRCWGEVDGERIDFSPIMDRPGHWEGYISWRPGPLDIEIWAENDRGRQRSYSVSGADSIFREIGYSRSNRSLPIPYSTFCRRIPRGIADEISEF